MGWMSKSAMRYIAVASLAGCGAESGKDTPADTAVVAKPSNAAATTALGTDRRPELLIVGTSLTAGLGLDPDSA